MFDARFPYFLFGYIILRYELISSFRSIQRNSRFRLAHFIHHHFYILDVSKIESRLVWDQIDCVLLCLEDQRCFSTNLAAKPDINGDYVCKLLPTDKYNASDSFRPSLHFHHYSVKTPCLSNPCQHNGFCQALYHTDDFECHANYSTRYCVEIPADVCMYGKGDKPGVFFAPLAGKIYSIRLAHISGKVGCGPNGRNNWGCGSYITTILTDKDNSVVFPEDHIARAYQLAEFTKHSPELVLTFTTPLMVTAGQEYRLWYLEDLKDTNEDDNNPGPSCMKVTYSFSL